MKLDDPLVLFTLGMVGLIGVLLLAAHHADEAGHRRAGIALVFSAIAALIAAVLGPYTVAGLAIIMLLYAVFLGLPVLGLVLLIRRLRRKGA